jgi:crotonobetainyl-CoA:carnitine CoA-transferase CaiB-like acyl-CoA transferase
MTEGEATAGPLADLRVIDCSTVVAGPGCARYLADFGADVIKVERPDGDTTRGMGWLDPSDDVTLWWKFQSRGKRAVVLDLKDPTDLDRMLRLVDSADVLVENFRPGTLERLGLGPDVLLARNPGLVVTRVTGFGQDGPYAQRPGFATLAEAMSGYAGLTGDPDGGPLLPPIALTDEITGLAAAFATMVAVHSGVGQVVDVNLLESLFQMMGPLIGAYRLHGYLQPRLGAGIPYSVPRGTYRTADGKWVAISTSAQSVAERVMRLVGRPELIDEPWFASGTQRAQHADELDEAVSDWIAMRPQAEVIGAFEAAEAAAIPIYDVADIMADPQVVARESITELPDPELGSVKMQNVMFRMLGTPAELRWAGRPVGGDNEEVYGEVGIDPQRLAQLHAEGVV